VATYTQEYGFASSSAGATLVQRVACAIVDYAASVVAAEGTGVTGHAARLALAQAAVAAPDRQAAEMILAVVVVLGNANNVAPTDADLKTTVAGLWNVYAGVG
jgi:hypothetical protein